ncbi:MAG: response regulator transcription factor [Sulfuricella sp.]|nr:response regulator transcription factor [Sulfuricella sp.]
MLAELSNLVLDLYRGCREQAVDTYQKWAFERLKQSLPFDSALWMTGALHPDGSDADIHTHYLHQQPLQLLIDWSRTPDRATFSRKVLRNPGISFSCITSQEFGRELAEHSRRYNIEHILATSLNDPVAHLSELISIYRADPASPFGEAERRLQQSIVPHLSETWRINRTHHLAQVSQPSCAVKAYSATVDSQGILHLIEPGFTRLLQNEWSTWQGPTLPLDLVKQMDQKGSRYIGNTLSISLSVLNDHFLLRGRQRTPVDALSKREREVAELFSAGSTYKDIAKTLTLSPATVRNYLNTVYLKLGVDNKAALVNMLKEHQ